MTTFVGSGYTVPVSSSGLSATNVTDMMNAIFAAWTGAGLVQTSDTGQFNPAAYPAWPGSTSTYMAGYWIFRFNDAAQSTDPIFMKVEVGRSGTPASGVNFRITVGQGSNGSGTITGTTGQVQCDGGGNGTNPQQTVNEYACHTAGYFLGVSRYGWTSGAVAGQVFVCARTRNPSTYALDGQGVNLYYNSTLANPWYYRGLRIVTLKWGVGVMNVGQNSFCVIPGLPANTALLNGDKQLYPHFYNWPDIRQQWPIFTARQSEISANVTTLTATPLSSGGARTFICFGTSALGCITASCQDDAAFTPCFLWE
jgi:hypothetical protein